MRSPPELQKKNGTGYGTPVMSSEGEIGGSLEARTACGSEGTLRQEFLCLRHTKLRRVLPEMLECISLASHPGYLPMARSLSFTTTGRSRIPLGVGRAMGRLHDFRGEVCKPFPEVRAAGVALRRHRGEGR